MLREAVREGGALANTCGGMQRGQKVHPRAGRSRAAGCPLSRHHGAARTASAWRRELARPSLLWPLVL